MSESPVVKDFVPLLVAPAPAPPSLNATSDAELALTRAAAAGDPAAIAELAAAVTAEVRRLHRRLGSAELSVEDAEQAVLERLFVAGVDGQGRIGQARIGSFSGTGSLQGFLRVVAVRTMTDLARARRKEVLADEGEPEALADSADDPELAHLKQHYRVAFKAAFHDAVAKLSPRQRNLLRHQLLRGLSIDDLAALYRIHRATAARWLDAARDDLRRHTRDAMRAHAGVDRLEFASIVRLVQSSLEVSAHRALAADTELEPEPVEP